MNGFAKKKKMTEDKLTDYSVDRFDLEQQIVECWRMVDDLKQFTDAGANHVELHSLAIYYDRKFNELWDTFEEMVRVGKFK